MSVVNYLLSIIFIVFKHLLFIIFSLAAKTGGRLNLLTQVNSTRAVMVREAVVSAQQQRLLLAQFPSAASRLLLRH